MKTKKYSGVIIPMMTPILENLEIDTKAVGKLTSNVVSNGGQPFVIGTTGESSSLSFQNKLELVEKTVETAQGKALVYAGISGNCYSESIELAKQFKEIGADVAVAHIPGYYEINQEEVYQYFTKLANNIELPLVVYNMPKTTNISLELDTIDRLSEHENIVALKDSERGEERMKNAISLWKDREDFSYLSGWAAKSFDSLKWGGDGIVPSTGNLTPNLYSILHKSILNQDFNKARAAQEKTDDISKIYQQFQPLGKSLAAFKSLLHEYDLCGPNMLPPLQKTSEEINQKIKTELKKLNQDISELNQL